MAAVTTFVLCMIFGPVLIKFFKERKIGEKTKRDDCPQLDHLHSTKAGTPTMGGIFIIGSIVISVLLWADLSNRYILLTLLTCVWLAILGGIDDYVKLTRKGRRGLTVRAKFFWQLVLGCIIGVFIYLDPTASTKLDVPFFKNLVIDIGIFYIPLVVLIIVGTCNAVNLTD